LVEIGRSLSLWLKDDYDRLRYILSQVHFWSWAQDFRFAGNQ
jgi:hypothetical protein